MSASKMYRCCCSVLSTVKILPSGTASVTADRLTVMTSTTTFMSTSSLSTLRSRSFFVRLQRAMFSSSAQEVAPKSVNITRTTGNSSGSDKSVDNAPRPAYDHDKTDATKLVDDLLSYTRSLMDENNERLGKKESGDQRHVHDRDRRHVIAFSGGIDSSLVAALVHQCVSRSPSTGATTDIPRRHKNESAVAVLGLSPAVPADQIELAQSVAQHIGIDLEQIPTSEGTDQQYIANNGQACLACKTHLYTCLSGIARHYGNAASPKNSEITDPSFDDTVDIRLYNGTNADDLNDPTRLGLIAASNFSVRSPLQHTPKHLVRIAGRHLGLPNWNYAASPCLRSRLALGVQAVPEHLQRIEQAEAYVRRQLDLHVTINLRVRLLSNNRAMIEVDEHLLEQAKIKLETWRRNGFFTSPSSSSAADAEGGGLGFASVDVRAFQTGSVAT